MNPMIERTYDTDTDGPEMPQNRNTVRVEVQLTADQIQRMAGDNGLRPFMYCGLADGMTPYHPIDIAFPNQIEVKINGDELKSNYKGLKNKPGSTKPADLTGRFRAKPTYQNQVSITYALTTKRYNFVIYLVRYITADMLVERIKTANVIPKQRVIDEMMNKANTDTEIQTTSTRMSLKDPISTVRITLPVRSTVCTHNQCFDGAMFLQLQEQAPQWTCPVCNKNVSFKSLCVDKYFEGILKSTSRAIEKVDVEPDGKWTVIKEEETEQTNGSTSKPPRASYDDDFDDDDELVEIVEPQNKHLNGLNRESQSTPNLLGGPSFATSMNTPPFSSREASVAQSTTSLQRAGSKRPASAVVDLTLSDEDDDPPRPAQRQRISNGAPRTTSSATTSGTTSSSTVPPPYNTTPASLPDPRPSYQQPFAQRQQTDRYRTPTFGTSSSLNGVRAPSIDRGGSSHLTLPRLDHQLSSSSHSSSPVRNNLRESSTWTAQSPRPLSQHPSQQQFQLQSRETPQPPLNGIQPFYIGPPQSSAAAQQRQQQQSQSQSRGSLLSRSPETGLRLAPLHMPVSEQQYVGGWRSDGESYSRSPG